MKNVAAGLLLIVVFAQLACTKMELVHRFRDQVKPPCVVASVNAEREATNDFYVIRSFNSAGKLMHIKTQLRDIYGTTYVYDYKISYSYNRALLTGTTTEIFWEKDNPEEWTEDPPVHPGSTSVIDNKPIEILFDGRTGFAKKVRYQLDRQPLLEVTYDSNEYLDSVKGYTWNKETDHLDTTLVDVLVDATGNITQLLKIGDSASDAYFGHVGVRYQYSENAIGKKHYYETPNIFIHPMYSLLEVLDWGPFQPNRQRIWSEVYWNHPPDEIDMDVFINAEYVDHQYDADGKLVSYTLNGETTRFDETGGTPWVVRPRIISWKCN
jgi:hypothetical protein